MKMSLDEARKRDKLIYDLALYEVTKGLIPTKVNSEVAQDLGTGINKQFNQFKRLLQSGEYTLEELENDVASRNSATPQSDEVSIDNIDEFVTNYDKKQLEIPPSDPFDSRIGTMVLMGLLKDALIDSKSSKTPIYDIEQDLDYLDSLDEDDLDDDLDYLDSDKF
jgi:hypothetical protein